jgi:hypothetical protein
MEQLVIDMGAEPFVPRGFEVVLHRVGEKFIFDNTKVELYLDESQKNGAYTWGNRLGPKLQKMPVLNANVLDALLANPQYIPGEWKEKKIFFWGTVYRDCNGSVNVRYLWCLNGRWCSDMYWVLYDWDDDDPALVLAN